MSLIELIVALAIISLIAGVIVTAVHQLLNSSRQANDQQYAVSQVRQAEHYITLDVLMTQQISSSGFPLLLHWQREDTSGNEFTYDVTYSLVGADENNQILRRVLTVNDITEDPDNPIPVPEESSTLIAAQGIVGSESSCVYGPLDAPNLTVTLVARSGTHDEVRVFEVKPRKTTVEVLSTP